MPTFERRRLMAQVLPPLLEDPLLHELILVNDGGRDGTLPLARELAAGDSRLIGLDLPHGGRQAARRAGIQAASGDIVLLLDDDVRAHTGLVTRHAEVHATAAADVVEGFMPVFLPARRDPGQVATYMYAEEYARHAARVEAEPGLCLYELWGGNVSLSRDLALEVTSGPEFPVSFGEDTHMGLLCLRKGAKGIFTREARADHLHSRRLDQFLRDSYAQGASISWLHRLHGDLLGPVQERRLTESIPSPIAWLLRTSPTATGYVGRAAVDLGRLSRSPKLETMGARLSRRAAMIAGYIGAQKVKRTT